MHSNTVCIVRARRWTFWFCVAAVAWSFSATLKAQERSDSSQDAYVPLAPVAPVEFQGWTNAFRLANTNIELVAVPAFGRIMSIRYRGGENLLRLDHTSAGVVPDAKATNWLNAGGEWLWPLAQSQWAHVAESDWPPPDFLADIPWTATAWTAADGSVNCTLSRHYGRPLHIKVSRTIRLDPERPEFMIRQRIERTRKSDIPLTFWNVFQISAAEKVVMPTDLTSAFAGGFRSMMFEAPPPAQLRVCDGALEYTATAGEHKLCSDSTRRWIAASKGNLALVLRASGTDSGGAYPDGGCSLEMYSNAGLGYTEIETLSRESVLAPGDVMQSVIVVQLIEPVPDAPCKVAEMLKTATGEGASTLPPSSGEEAELTTAAPATR